VAGAAGVPPIGYAFWLAAGGGAFLLAVALARGEAPPVDRRHLAYYAVAGLLSLALPHSVAVMVVPHVGAGLVGLLYTLPPAVTYALAVPLGMERVQAARLAGLGLGFAGALVLVVPEGSLPEPDMLGWLALGVVAPVSLALGNIWRSRAWPAGSGALPLAAGTLIAAAAMLAGAMAATGQGVVPLPVRHAGDVAVLAQIAVAGVSYFLFFELQRRTGPVYLSQIGYIITAVGVATGAVFFDERFTTWFWLAVALMAAGLALVNRRPAQG
jgi:drug/metabolite transporter (DMT)-like permease